MDTALAAPHRTYANYGIKVDGFITVYVNLAQFNNMANKTFKFTNLDLASYHINESLPLEIFGKLSKPLPLISQCFGAVLVLLFLDLTGRVISRLR